MTHYLVVLEQELNWMNYIHSNRLFPALSSTVKPVCNDHLFDKINYLWFIQ